MPRKQETVTLAPSVDCAFSNRTAKRNVTLSVWPIISGASAVAFNFTCQVRAEYLSTKYHFKTHSRFQSAGDNDTKVCRSSNFRCFERAKSRFYKKFVSERCDCLPDCISVEYGAKTELIQYFHLGTEQDWKKVYNRNK